VLLLAYALTMVAAVVLSSISHRTMLSSTVLFFVAGVLVGPQVFGLLDLGPDTSMLTELATIALFIVLVTDGSRVRLNQLRTAWSLPTRALLGGIPLTIALIAFAAHYTVHLRWIDALLLGAVLSPTDPVLASAIIGRERVPARVRWLLNGESGANDGLALPAVLALTAAVSTTGLDPAELLISVPVGVAIGVAVPWLVLRVATHHPFGISERAEPLAPVAAALLVYAVAEISNGNLFLAGFAAGITLGNVRDVRVEAFHRFSDPLSDVAKLTALFAFGSLVTWSNYFTHEPWTVFLLAALVIFAVRPAVILITMIGAGLTRAELAIAGWFGPRGFASVVYGLYVLHTGGTDALRVFRLTALVVGASIVLHSSTDVVAVRILAKRAEREEREESPDVEPGSHRLLDPSPDQPRIDGQRREEADDHGDLHEEPVRDLRRLQVSAAEQNELHDGHPTEHADFERGE
jgi:NhaP-type Na+/H+ or K+/H+ antiporter